jgi:hypothetical protein
MDKKFLHVLTRHGEYALNLTQKTKREHLRAQLVAQGLAAASFSITAL